jgi:hypothetical protein
MHRNNAADKASITEKYGKRLTTQRSNRGVTSG